METKRENILWGYICKSINYVAVTQVPLILLSSFLYLTGVLNCDSIGVSWDEGSKIVKGDTFAFSFVLPQQRGRSFLKDRVHSFSSSHCFISEKFCDLKQSEDLSKSFCIWVISINIYCVKIKTELK